MYLIIIFILFGFVAGGTGRGEAAARRDRAKCFPIAFSICLFRLALDI